MVCVDYSLSFMMTCPSSCSVLHKMNDLLFAIIQYAQTDYAQRTKKEHDISTEDEPVVQSLLRVTTEMSTLYSVSRQQFLRLLYHSIHIEISHF
jgi:hypothetical protein